MKKTKTKSKKYPLKVTLKNGKKLIIPKQSAFKNAFLHDHGCSIMAEYVALQYVGVHKWPIDILKWHRKHDKKNIMAKVTVKGVSVGIAKIGKVDTAYYSHVTADRIRDAMKKGRCVIMEQKDPIHSVALIPDGGKLYKVSYGTVTQVTASGIAKTATTSKTYRGMVVVK